MDNVRRGQLAPAQQPTWVERVFSPQESQQPERPHKRPLARQAVRLTADQWRQEIEATNRNWLNRAITPFWWPAQQFERAIGFARQLFNTPEERAAALRDPRAAWQAGEFNYASQAYRGTDFRPVGYRMLHEARTMLASGMSLVDVQAEIQSRYPEQQVRAAEMNQIVGQGIFDPLWLVGSPVAAVQRTAAGARWIGRATEAARLADRAVDAMRIAEEASRPIDEVAELARAALTATERAAEAGGRSLRWYERVAITLTGGIPMGPEDAARWAAAGKVGILEAVRGLLRGDFRTAARWGGLPHMLFRLTPESAAHEVIENLDRFVQVSTASARTVGELRSSLFRARSALTSGRLGSAAASPGARAMAAWLDQVMPKVDNLIDFFSSPMAREQMADIAALARVAGKSTDELMGMIWRGQVDELVDLVRRGMASPGMENLAREIAARLPNIDASTLRGFGDVFRDLPYNEMLLRTHLRAAVAEASAQLASRTLGIREAGFWVRQARSLKAVETLLYLRINPAYFVRNLWNNEMTMLAHGIWNLWSAERVAAIWERAGVMDPRAFAGIGAADIGPARAETAADAMRGALANAGELIGDAARGGSTWLERLVGKVQDMLPTDAGRWARAAESWASSRATTAAFAEAYPYYARLGVGYSAMPDALRQAIGEDQYRAIAAALPNAMNAAERRAVFYSDNLNLSLGMVLDDVGRRTGIDLQAVRDVFGPELMGEFEQDLAAAMRAGDTAAVDGLLGSYSKRAEQRISEALRGTNWEQYASETIQADGPTGVARVWGESTSYANSGMEAHLRNLNDDVARLRLLPTRSARQAAWRHIDRRSTRFWDHIRGTIDDQMRGLVAGARRAGLEIGDDLTELTARRSESFGKFFEERTRLTGAFFGTDWADDAARAEAYRTLQDQLDTSYGVLIDAEQRAATELDNTIGALIQDPQLRATHDVLRSSVRRIRQEYMTDVRAAYRQAAYMDEPTRAVFFRDRVGPRRVRYNLDTVAAEREWAATLGGRPTVAVPSAAGQEIDRLAAGGLEVLNPIGKSRLLDTLEAEGSFNIRVVPRLGSVTGEAGPEFGMFRVVLDAAPPGTPIPIEASHFALRQTDDQFRQGLLDELAHVLLEPGPPERRGLGYAQSLSEFLGGPTPLSSVDVAHNLRFQDGWRMFWINPDGLRQADPALFTLLDDIARREPDLSIVRSVASYEMERVTMPVTGRQASFLPDLRQLVPSPQPTGSTLWDVWSTDGGRIMDEMGQSARDLMGRPPLRIRGLAPEQQAAMRVFAARVEDESGGVMLASLNTANMRRDMALLNYNRRTDFDTYSNMLFPFSFWTTHSMQNWFLWSVDHAAWAHVMLTFRNAVQNATAVPGTPRRMQGMMPTIRLPFAPEWMGPAFVNPFGIGLPLEQWIRTAESVRYELTEDEQRIVRELDVQLENGQIDQETYQQAVQTRSGEAWNSARREVNNGEDNWLDAMSLLTSPHAPLMWAYNAARGRPFQPGPFLPATRTIRGFAGMFGADINIEAPLRRALGLPVFDEYEIYRVRRQLSNMAVEGYPVDLLERARAEQSGPLWEEAQRRALQQYSVGANLGLLGIPAQAYPPGEQRSRELMEQFGEAVEAEDGGDEGAIGRFLEANPEVGLRLGLNDTPEETTQRFLVDLVWNGYNQLTDYNQQEAVEQLGPLFEQTFLSRETRDYSAVPAEILAMWARALGQDPPGQFVPGPGTAMALQLTPANISQRIQAFYDTRRGYFPWDEIRETQNRYYRIDEGAARRQFRTEHPELVAYWSWRRDFLYRNPDLIPYMVEDPEAYTYPSEAALMAAEEAQPSLQPAEWYQVLGPQVWALVEDYQAGEPLPEVAMRRIREIADQYGTTVDHILSDIARGLAQ